MIKVPCRKTITISNIIKRVIIIVYISYFIIKDIVIVLVIEIIGTFLKINFTMNLNELEL